MASSSGSLPIRAPLTLDTDSDYESDGHKTFSSVNSSGFESEEVFQSGDEFETASESHFVAEPDKRTLESNDFGERIKISRPFVADPNESSVEEEFVYAMDNVGSKLVMPIAQLSMEEDEFDEALGSEVEEGGFSDMDKVPGGVVSAPRVKVILGLENEESAVEDTGADDEPKADVGSLKVNRELLGEEASKVEASVEATIEGNSEVEKLERIDSNHRNVYQLEEEGVVTVDPTAHASEPGMIIVDKIVLTSGRESKVEEAIISTGCHIAAGEGIEVEKTEGPTDGEVGLRDELHEHPISTCETVNTVNCSFPELSEGQRPENPLLSDSDSRKFVGPDPCLDNEVAPVLPYLGMHDSNKVDGRKSLLSDKEALELLFGGLQKKEIINEKEQGLTSPSCLKVELHDHLAAAGQQIGVESDEEMGSDAESGGKKLINYAAALDTLVQAATGVEPDGGNLTRTSSNASRVFSPDHSNNSDTSFTSSGFPSPSNMFDVKHKHNLSDKKQLRNERMQSLRVKFLRLVQRLGHSTDDSIVAQVLYKIAAVSGSHYNEELCVESANKAAIKLEAEGKDDLDFTLNILVLGKTGVGKSATINSVFGAEIAKTGAFGPSTSAIKEIVGTVNGVNIRIIDTPGLRSAPTEEATNRKILASVKRSMQKFPPDVVLYVDRLDTSTVDLSDLPVLKSITKSLGSSLWRNTIVTFTHAGTDPPDGPSGSQLSYEVFVAQKSHMVQQAISRAVDSFLLMNPGMMHPVCLVENHSACQKNKGESVLPNGQRWRPQLLLLCYSLKILSEASSLSKHQDPFDHQKLLGFRLRSLPLPYFLSILLQSRTHPNLSVDKDAGIFDLDAELTASSHSDLEDEDEYEQLPPFKPLTRSQVSKLSKEQRKAYFEEYDYRVKLLQKKQWREEIKRSRELKKKGNEVEASGNSMGEDGDHDGGGPETVPVPLPDFVLPPSFDGDKPSYRYRSLESMSLLLTRPILDSQGWDHDVGYNGVSLESDLVVAGSFPCAFAMQITKEKNEFNLRLDSSVCAKHGDKRSTMAGFDIQTFRRQLAYVVRGETKFKNFKVNETAAGLSVTLFGENVATGLKIEDQIALGKCLVLAGSAGTMHSQGDTAYGANLEIRLQDKDFPIEQNQTSFSVSLTKWRGDLSLMANLQSHFSVGRGSRMAVHVGLNSKRSGKMSLKISSSDHLEIALGAILPAALSIIRSICSSSAA